MTISHFSDCEQWLWPIVGQNDFSGA